MNFKAVIYVLITIFLVILLFIRPLTLFGLLGLFILTMAVFHENEKHLEGKIEAPGRRIGVGLVYSYRNSMPYLYRKVFSGKERESIR